VPELATTGIIAEQISLVVRMKDVGREDRAHLVNRLDDHQSICLGRHGAPSISSSSAGGIVALTATGAARERPDRQGAARGPYHDSVPARARGWCVGAGRQGVTRRGGHGKRPVTARLIEVGVDELLAGYHLSSRVCPHCGHPPDDFIDEETVVTDQGDELRDARQTQEIKGDRHAGRRK